MTVLCARVGLALGFLLGSSMLTATAVAELRVSPLNVVLDRPEASQQLLVTELRDVKSPPHDLTRAATYSVSPEGVIAIGSDGLVQPLTDGNAQIVIKTASGELQVGVTVSGQKAPPPVSFQHEIIPLLTKGRCNSGGCHGKAEGQNGFKLSLLGYDWASDYDALIKEGKGRRVDLAHPDRSMLLVKGAALVPHGGGRKIELGTPGFKRLQRWLADGAPRTLSNELPIVRIEVEPANVIMTATSTQQLRVTAIDEAGGRRCCTVEADYFSNAEHVVGADSRGLLRSSEISGSAAILVRYLGHVAVCRVTLPQPKTKFVRPAEANFVDKHVWDRLQELGIQPSPPADDATFLRRVYLDTIGTLPTATEARAFLTDTSANKRAKLINELLNRSEYADFWAMKWTDLLRADKLKVTPQGTVGLTRWLRKQFRDNRPYNEFVREIITAQGPVQNEGPVAFFKSVDTPEVAARSVSQLFLGVRIECAQCHHHPSERWGQDDYAGFVGFFTGVATKKLPDGTDAIVARAGTDQKHPRTGQLVAARALGAADADFANVTDRRHILAAWMTSDENPFVAAAIANRIWAHYFGRGLVEPIDDLRVTNPATNEPLMTALVAHLRAVKYDLKAFTATLLTSQTYQLQSDTNDSNIDDRQNFSHSPSKPLAAEVLLDAICQTTGVPEKFNGWPLGVRAIHVWDNRMPSYFFRIFGRPVRATVCECERSTLPSIAQALHLMNSPEVHEKLTHRHGAARKLADSNLSSEATVDELFLSTLSRFPTTDERALLMAAFEGEGSSRRQAIEDILWSLLNTKEFLYNH